MPRTSLTGRGSYLLVVVGEEGVGWGGPSERAVSVDEVDGVGDPVETLLNVLSHPVPDPVIGPQRQTPTGPTRLPGLLFECSTPLTLTYSFPARHPRNPLQTLPVPGHPLHSTPSFCLSFRLTYLICVYPLVSASLYRTSTPVLTHRTPTGPPIRTRSLSI